MLHIYLTVEGQERLALGSPLYSWNYAVREELVTDDAGYALLGSFEPVMPSAESCIPPVLAKLKAREAEINASAHAELRELAERRNNLLSLSYSGAA